MKRRGLIVIVVFCLCGWFASSQEIDKQFQSCIDAFVVHRDKIIRTQDSRDMGAKYLTEFDVESRIECMRWCCETDHCDVFIFEEKKPGSCYLFHCGPPHDFKCKFTSHANYSSAVLTNYNIQNAAALEEQIRRNQQEHELKSLRKQEPPSKEYSYYTNNPPVTSSTPVPPSLSTSTTAAPIKAPACSRNQFECRSNDDCIAIYNVCDGIPQCADGSDEAVELGCPSDRTTMPPPPPPAPPQSQGVVSPKPYIPLLPESLRYQQMIQQQQQQQQQQQHSQYPMMYPGAGPEGTKLWPNNPNLQQLALGQDVNYNGRGYNNQQQQQQHQQQQQQIPQQSPDESMGGVAVGTGQQLPINFKSPGYQWNNYQAPIYEQNPNKINNNLALDVMHAQNAIPPSYAQEQPSRIFNHKGPGMHLDEMEAVNNIYGQDPNRGYAPYYPGIIHRADSWQEGNQGQPIQVPVVTPEPQHHEHPHVEPKKHSTTSTSTPPCDPSEKQEDDDASKTKNLDNNKKAENDEAHKRVYSSATQPKDTNNKKTPTETHENKPVSQSIVKEDNHKAHESELRSMSSLHRQEEKNLAIAEHIRHHTTKLEDLEMTRPKGAVISLALGLTVTAVMAVLIACRLRVVKRRGRGRGHDSYAHDADYLVNGMYL